MLSCNYLTNGEMNNISEAFEIYDFVGAKPWLHDLCVANILPLVEYIAELCDIII